MKIVSPDTQNKYIVNKRKTFHHFQQKYSPTDKIIINPRKKPIIRCLICLYLGYDFV